MDAGVRAAVSEAYRVFSRYSFGAGSPVDQDTGPLGPLEERLLRLTPLSEVSPELLAAYAGSLPVSVDGMAADDFRALLPRYFELIAVDGYAVDGWKEEALRGLARAEYRTRWPADEAGAVDGFFAALLKAAESRGGGDDVAALRGLIAGAGGEVSAPRPEV